jgi:tRNA pseudouridine55 synthase
MNGVLIVDKPTGLTSHDVVNRVRRVLDQKSVGHVGTLDPLATGVLPLVIGNLTRLAQFYTTAEKQYEGVIRFGFSTDTYDAEGEPSSVPQVPQVTLEQLRTLAMRFRGDIEQVPPPFSAKKIQGIPAYKLARKKKDVPLKPAQVKIMEFEIENVEEGQARFRARVASGTYMRSIAHDLGQLAGCGAHLQSLRRTAVSEFTIEDAHTIEQLEQAGDSPSREVLFIHPRRLLPQFPSVTATPDATVRIRNGRSVNLPELSRSPLVKVFDGQSDLIAICSRVAGTLFHPKIVLVGSGTGQVT